MEDLLYFFDFFFLVAFLFLGAAFFAFAFAFFFLAIVLTSFVLFGYGCGVGAQLLWKPFAILFVVLAHAHGATRTYTTTSMYALYHSCSVVKKGFEEKK